VARGRRRFGGRTRAKRPPVDWTVNSNSWTPTWDSDGENYVLPAFIEVETQRTYELPPELEVWTRSDDIVPNTSRQQMAAQAAGLPQPERMIERIKGSLHVLMTGSPSTLNDDFGTVELRIGVARGNSYTGTVGLIGAEDKLSDPVVADNSFMWHHTFVWWNAFAWFSEDQTFWPAVQQVELDVRVKRKLEPFDRLILQIENGTQQRIRLVRRLRVLTRTV